MDIIPVFGLPGSGKGTQCRSFAQLPGWGHLSTGELLRSIDDSTEEGSAILAEISKGRFATDEQIVQYMHAYFAQKKFSQNTTLLFDGFPRTLGQISFVEHFGRVPGAIYLKIGKDESINRLRNRNEGRMDDMLAQPLERILRYDRKTKPVVEYYERAGLLRKVEGEGSLLEVHYYMTQALKEFI